MSLLAFCGRGTSDSHRESSDGKEEEGSVGRKEEKNKAELKFPTTKMPGQNGAISLVSRRNIILI